MKVQVSGDPTRSLAERFALEFPSSGVVHLAVSGGNTPQRLFRLLATEFRDAVAWDRVELWQVDERCVPPDHADSNWRMIAEELLDRIGGLTAHRLEAECDDAAEKYEQLLRERVPAACTGLPVLDFVFLGMGRDGHTASLFPGTAAVEEESRLVVLNEVPQLNTRRVTMTFPLLQAAQRRWFLVSGEDKANAFALVLDRKLPASRLRAADWFIDPSVTEH